MSVFCSACRTENLATSRFCMSCGAALVAIPLRRASADGFATLGVVWEEAYSNLLLAETVGKDGPVEPYEGRLVRPGHIPEVGLGE